MGTLYSAAHCIMHNDQTRPYPVYTMTDRQTQLQSMPSQQATGVIIK